MNYRHPVNQENNIRVFNLLSQHLLLCLALLLPKFMNAQWQITKTTKFTNNYDFQGLRVAYLENGDYVVCGNVIDTIILDKHNAIYPSANPGIYIARFNAQDSVIWKQVFQPSGSSTSVSITENIEIVNNQHIIIAGSFKGSVRFPNGSSKYASTTDAYWLRYSTDGKVKGLGTYSKGLISALAVSKDLTIAIGGRVASNPSGAFIGVYDSVGNLLKNGNKFFLGTSQNRDIINALSFGNDNSLYFSGKANGDSIGLNGKPFIDAPNNINQYNLFFGKFNPDLSLSWLKGAFPMGKSRPYQFNIRKMLFQPQLNRILYAGMFEGANYQIDNDTLAITSLVNTDSRKPIILCTDTTGKLIWHQSLKLDSENQRGEIFTLAERPNGYILSADIEHYLNTPMTLGDVEFKFNNKAFLILLMDSFGKFSQAFGTNPTEKVIVNNVLSTTYHPEKGLKFTLINNASDSVSIPQKTIYKGSFLLSANKCSLNASINNNFKSICNNENTITLKGSPAGGDFRGKIIDSNGTIDPNKHAPGKYFFEYWISDNNGCQASAKDSILINAPTDVKIEPIDSVFCPKDTLIALKPSIAGGSFQGKGVAGSTFNPSLAGTGMHFISYTYTNKEKCRSSDTISIRVKSNAECIQTNEVNQFDPLKISISPNPSSGVIHVFSPEISVHKASLYTPTGLKIVEIKSISDIETISISPSQKGLHILILEMANGQYVSRKILIQ